MSNEIMIAFGSGPAVLAAKAAELYSDSTDQDQMNAFWSYPFNGVVTILAIAVQPILSTIALVAAAIFKLIGCCSDEYSQSATNVLHEAVCGFASGPELFVRIFNPTFCLKSELRVRHLEDGFSAKVLFAAPACLAAMTGRLCDDYTAENGAHALWTYPLNGIVTLLAIAVQPILSVIGIVAAAIFRQLGCCSKMYNELAHSTFQAAIGGLAAGPALFVRIFNPSLWMHSAYNMDMLAKDYRHSR